MAGKACELVGSIRIADYLSLGLLARLVPPALVDRALTKHGKHSRRQRDLPAHAVAYYVMALSLYRGINTEEVLRVVTEGMEYLGANAIRREVGKSAISAARTRLGAAAMASIAEEALAPLASDTTPGAFYSGLRVVSLDGSTLEVATRRQPESFVRRGPTRGAPGTRRFASWGCWRTAPMACSASPGGTATRRSRWPIAASSDCSRACCAWPIAALPAIRCGRRPCAPGRS
jgi:hypothetical protein